MPLDRARDRVRSVVGGMEVIQLDVGEEARWPVLPTGRGSKTRHDPLRGRRPSDTAQGHVEAILCCDAERQRDPDQHQRQVLIAVGNDR